MRFGLSVQKGGWIKVRITLNIYININVNNWLRDGSSVIFTNGLDAEFQTVGMITKEVD